MVGHTGIYEAIEKAVVAIDNCVKDTVEVLLRLTVMKSSSLLTMEMQIMH